MKKNYLLLFALLFSIAAHAQWTLVGTAFTGSVRGMHFFDENTGFAVGGDNATIGYIAKTTDGGATWTSANISGTTLLRSIMFLNTDTGFTCGQGGTVFKTTDGGSTWTNIYTNATSYFRAIDFVTSQIGFVGGAAGNIFNTTDGGSTWTSTNVGQSTSDIIQLQMADATTGYAVASSGTFASGYILKTSDGGATWTQAHYNASTGFLALTVVDAQTVYAGGNGQTILKSTDGGATWSTVNTGTAGTSFRSATHTDADHIYLADDGTGNLSNGSIVSTGDAGTTWQDTSFTGIVFLNITFPTASVGYASNTIGGVYKLIIPPPPPPQWTFVSTPFANIVRGLYFTDEDNGWAVGNGGFISKTTDGFVTYTAQTSGVTTALRSVFFLDSNTGFTCGEGGVVKKTTDGGTTWTSSNSGIGTTYCRAVDFPTEDLGFIGGAAGVIFKSEDGGATWTSYQLDQSTSDVIQLDMVDENTGYAVCSGGVFPFANGYVYKTTDGGSSWSQVYYNAGTGLLGLAVVNSSTVYAGGTNQFIAKTDDGGATWNEVYTGVIGPAVRCGAAASAYYVFMGDDNSYIVSTDDAGSTWSDTILAGGLYSMHFPTSTVGYTGTGAGGIYKIVLPCVTPEAPSAIIGSTTFCSGDIVSFSVDEVGGADSYDWLLPEGSTIISGEGTNSIEVEVGTNSGAVSVTASNDCATSDATSQEITVYITPAIPTITFTSGELNSSATSGNQWYYNGNEIAGATDQTYTPSANGTYSVVVTENGCSSVSEPFEVVGVGINELNGFGFSIAPNPMSEFTQINVTSINAERLLVTDVQGKVIINMTLTTSRTLILNRNDLSEGMYLVQLLNGNNELISRSKLIVQ